MLTPNMEVASMKYTARRVAQQVSVGSEAVSPPERSACAWDRMYRCLSRPSCLGLRLGLGLGLALGLGLGFRLGLGRAGKESAWRSSCSWLGLGLGLGLP